MKFEHASGIMYFYNDKGGSHAAMFDPNGLNMMERADLNSFNDAAKKYHWAFVWFMPLQEGQLFTFAVVEYDCTCKVVGSGDAAVLQMVKVKEKRFDREQPGGRPISMIPSFAPLVG